jgi:hypothetical protein
MASRNVEANLVLRRGSPTRRKPKGRSDERDADMLHVKGTIRRSLVVALLIASASAATIGANPASAAYTCSWVACTSTGVTHGGAGTGQTAVYIDTSRHTLKIQATVRADVLDRPQSLGADAWVAPDGGTWAEAGFKQGTTSPLLDGNNYLKFTWGPYTISSGLYHLWMRYYWCTIYGWVYLDEDIGWFQV